jgi:hypothetical protein
LLEEALKVFLSRFLAHTTDEDLGRPLLLFPWNSTLRVDLTRALAIAKAHKGKVTHDLAVKVMFLDHYNIYALGIFEGEETKPPGSASGTIAHDGAFTNLTELG